MSSLFPTPSPQGVKKPKPKGTLRRLIPPEVLAYYEANKDRAKVPLKNFANRVHIDCWELERALVTELRVYPKKPNYKALQRSLFNMCSPPPE